MAGVTRVTKRPADCDVGDGPAFLACVHPGEGEL